MDQAVVYGGTANFTVVATSGTALSYQWYEDGLLFLDKKLTGQTSSTLTLTNVSYSDEEQYYVEVRNAGGKVTSREATLKIDTEPVAYNETYTTLEDVPLIVPAAGILSNDTDVESTALSAWLVSDVSNGTLNLNTNGSFTYTPDSNFNGTDSFTYRATDGLTTGNVATVTINITPVNDASPVANNDTYTTLEDVPLTVSAPGILLNDTDVDGDALTAVLVSNVSNGSLSLNTDGSFTYTPNTNSSGTITTNTASVIVATTVTVIVTNNTGTVPSTAVGSTFGTISPAAGVGTVTDRFVVGTNFHGLTYAGEDHGYAATKFYSLHHDNGANTNFFDTLAPTGVTGTITDRFTLTQNNFDALTYASPDLGYGPIIFYYLRHDADGRSSFGSITPGGVVGVVADHKVVGTNFVALTFSATDVGYGANLFYYVRRDTNCNSIFGTIDPAQGGPVTDRFSIGANVDALVFTSTDAGYGANNFYYLRHDAGGVSTFGTIFVTGLTNGTVTDRFPVGTNVTELAFTATDVLYGPNLFYYLRGTPKPGCPQITFTTNIVTTLTTNTDFNGSDSFTYRAADGSSTGNVATVTINVIPVNDPPLAVNDSTNTLEDASVTIKVLANDSDPEGTPLTLTGTATTNGTAVISGPNIVFTPSANFNGVVVFSYTVSDGALSATASVIVTVTPVHDTPLSLDSAELTAAGFTFQFSVGSASTYVIEASTNLTDWTSISTNSTLIGQVAFTDTTATNHPRRFYRVIAR